MNLREALDRYVRKALQDAGVRIKDCRLRGQDTGIVILVSSATAATHLLRDFVRALGDHLSLHDGAYQETHRLAIRLGMHQGLVTVHGGHWSSRALHELTQQPT
jgi:cystathionine beta-lyase/cystathionine gamma-synthase